MVKNTLAPETPSPLAPASAKAITPSPVPRRRNPQGYDAGIAVYNKKNVAANVLPQDMKKKLSLLLPLPDSWVEVPTKADAPASPLPIKHGFIHFEDPASPRRRRRKSEPWGPKIAAFEAKDYIAPSVPQTPECFSPRASTETAESEQSGNASGRCISISDALFSGSSATAVVPRRPPVPERVLRLFEYLPPAPSSPAQLRPRQLSFSGASLVQGRSTLLA